MRGVRCDWPRPQILGAQPDRATQIAEVVPVACDREGVSALGGVVGCAMGVLCDAQMPEIVGK